MKLCVTLGGQFKTSAEESCPKFCFSMTMPDHTRQTALKNSLIHLNGRFPSYSPDLAPSDFHLFPRMKTWLTTQRFDDDEELRVHVTKWLRSQMADFYDEGISKLVHCYNKCLNLLGDYVEK